MHPSTRPLRRLFRQRSDFHPVFMEIPRSAGGQHLMVVKRRGDSLEIAFVVKAVARAGGRAGGRG